MKINYLNEIGEKLISLDRSDLVNTIKATSGRIIVGETVAFKAPLIDGVSNMELLKSFGVDMVTINHYDVDMPMIPGLESTGEGISKWAAAWNVSNEKGCLPDPQLIEPSQQVYFKSFGFGRTISEIRRLVGIPVGTTLEPVIESDNVSLGRLATEDNARAAVKQGVNYITIIRVPSMPGNEFASCVASVRKGVDEKGLVKAGKMPWGGIFKDNGEKFISREEIKVLANAGADVVIIPAPGTIPGLTIEVVKNWVGIIHEQNLLAEVTIGTSQEGAEKTVINRMAIDSKMTGADLYQIGDGVYSGISTPENVMAFAAAIKGRRHYLRRAALSPLR